MMYLEIINSTTNKKISVGRYPRYTEWYNHVSKLCNYESLTAAENLAADKHDSQLNYKFIIKPSIELKNWMEIHNANSLKIFGLANYDMTIQLVMNNNDFVKFKLTWL